MTKYKSQGLDKTFRNARKGFNLAIRSEMNIRVHVIIAAIVIFFAIILNFSALEFSVLFLVIALVIVSEMLNTAIEFALDSIYHNKYSKMVGMAKDISAGAVMLATFTSILVGFLLFGSKIILHA